MCEGELRGNPASGVKPYNSTSGSAVATTFLAEMSLSKSIPVFRPIASSKKTRSSVTILPLAPGAAGQPQGHGLGSGQRQQLSTAPGRASQEESRGNVSGYLLRAARAAGQAHPAAVQDHRDSPTRSTCSGGLGQRGTTTSRRSSWCTWRACGCESGPT